MQLQKCQSLPLSSWHTRDVNQIYQKIGQVGQGTYGKVFKAKKQQHQAKIEYVALKQLNTEKETEGFPLTALREIKILQQLNHPNIVKLHEVVISKCANLLYGNNGVLKLGDFGLSNAIKNRPLTNRVVTLCYRAPEILLGNSELNQIKLIFERCGFNLENWPDAQNYPYYPNITLKSENNHNTNNNNNNNCSNSYIPSILLFSNERIDENALDLITNLLELNPDKRLSASEALEHRYFKSQPEICPLAKMTKLEQGKELHAQRKNPQQQQLQQQSQQQQQQLQNNNNKMKAFGKQQQPQQSKFDPSHPNSRKNGYFNSIMNQGKSQQQQYSIINQYKSQLYPQQQLKNQQNYYNNFAHSSCIQNFNRQQFHSSQNAHKVLLQKQLNNQEQQTEIKTNFIPIEISARSRAELKQYATSNLINHSNSNKNDYFDQQLCLQPKKKIKLAEQADVNALYQE